MKPQLNRIKAGLSLTALLAVTLSSVFFPSPAFAAPIVQGEAGRAAADSRCSDEGFTQLQSGEPQAALDDFEGALALDQKSGDRAQQALCLYYIGAAKQYVSDYAGALTALQGSLSISQEIGDRTAEGWALNKIGAVYDDLGKYSQALDSYQQALPIAEKAGDRAMEWTTLNNFGAIYRKVGQYSQALDYYQKALPIAKGIGDRAGEGTILNNTGLVYDDLGKYPQALDSYQQALTIMKELGDRAGQATTLSNIGFVLDEQGQYAQAVDNYQQALAIEKEIGDRAGAGNSLQGIGRAYYYVGHYGQALNYDQQALAIQKDIGDRVGQATTLSNIAVVYNSLGQSSHALDYQHQALTIDKELGNRAGEAGALANIGSVYSGAGQYSQALESYQQALAIMKEIGYRAGEGTILTNIGFAYDGQGQHSQALQSYQEALAIMKEIGDREGEGATLNNIGFAYDEQGQYPQALDYYQQALAIQKEIGDRAGEGTTLGSIGYVYQAQGDTAQAVSFDKQAIDINETVRSDIKVDELKASFASDRNGAYERLILMLWDQARYQEAFDYAERARARAFLDELAGGHVDFHAGADADLLKREQTLQGEIDVRRSQFILLHNGPQNAWDIGAMDAAEKDLQKSEDDFAQLIKDMKAQSPEVAALVSVQVASLADVQALLDKNTTLLEYFMTPDRTLAFIITHDRFDTVALDVSQDDLSKTIEDFRGFPSRTDPHPAGLKQLYTWLIAPLKNKLKTPVVGIIPHGVLHYLPFAALDDGQHYLGDDHTLFTLPSASVLRFIQEKRKPAISSLVALGQPTTNEPNLAQLKSAKEEVDTAAKLFGTDALVGDAATETALRARAGGASIVHLAAHGTFDSGNPLFSAIYLAPDKQNDGRLEVNEIYSLDLTKATDLVVLSACQTDIGALSGGDEVVGMTRAFLYAGTPTVIASLWDVDDAATTMLMEGFYTHLREGQGKAQALQQAQREVRAKYPNPYYWAAFVLTGDPGIEMSKPQSAVGAQLPPLFVIAAGIAGLALVVLLAVLIVLARGRRSASSRKMT